MIYHWLMLHNNTAIMITSSGSTSFTSIKLNNSNAYSEQLCTTYPSIIEVPVTTSLTKLWSNTSRANPNTHVQHKNGPTHFALPNPIFQTQQWTDTPSETAQNCSHALSAKTKLRRSISTHSRAIWRKMKHHGGNFGFTVAPDHSVPHISIGSFNLRKKHTCLLNVTRIS